MRSRVWWYGIWITTLVAVHAPGGVPGVRAQANEAGAAPKAHRQFSEYFSRELFAARRRALAAKLGTGVAIIQGAHRPRAFVPFRQDNTFFYLTGVEAPGAILWINGADGRSTLFLPERSAMTDEGPQLVPNEAAIAITGMDNVTSMRWLYMSLAMRRPDTLFVISAPGEIAATARDGVQRAESDLFGDPWAWSVPPEAAFIGQLHRLFPTVPLRDITPTIDEMRWVKDSGEVRALRAAGRIGVEAIAEAIRATRPGIIEHELADVARYVFMRRSAKGEAYFPVVASGSNSVFTHYGDNARRIEPRDLIVMDYAPDFQYETVDITRTWPASGRFDAEQVRYYDVVLEAHRAMIDAIKPGVTVNDLRALARRIYERHGMAERFPGGVGHFVGMSVHDPGPYERPFVPGVVFNVEPMIGVPEKGWHFRIEDTILVTESGHEILTAGLPWELEEIYRLRDGGSTLELPAPSRTTPGASGGALR